MRDGRKEECREPKASHNETDNDGSLDGCKDTQIGYGKGKTHEVVRESFSCGVHGTRHASMSANTSNKAARDKEYHVQLAELRFIAKPCVKDTTYSRITRQEEYKRGDKKWSWTVCVDNFAHERASHVYSD
jgi:hypothetical protein